MLRDRDDKAVLCAIFLVVAILVLSIIPPLRSNANKVTLPSDSLIYVIEQNNNMLRENNGRIKELVHEKTIR